MKIKTLFAPTTMISLKLIPRGNSSSKTCRPKYHGAAAPGLFIVSQSTFSSDRLAVKFTYKSFIFAASDTTAEINLSCDIKLCPQNSVECLKVCNEEDTVTSSDTMILVIVPNPLNYSYVLNVNTLTTSPAYFTSINNDDTYLSETGVAVLADKMYFLGGYYGNKRKIVKLNSCSLIELGVELYFRYVSPAVLVSADGFSNVLICFSEEEPYNQCNVFDGLHVTLESSSTYEHFNGKLGYYNGQPTTVGGQIGGTRKTEVLGLNGWTSLSDHPNSIHAHSLVGLTNGDLLLLGGIDLDISEFSNKIMRLSRIFGHNLWTVAGTLQQVCSHGTAKLINNSLFVFPGRGDDRYGIQRVNLSEDNTITTVDIIGNHEKDLWNPYAFKVDRNPCPAP